MSGKAKRSSNSLRTGEPDESFGEYLKYLRRRAYLTQEELGRAVGYSREQITRLERNQRLPDSTALSALFIPALDLQPGSTPAIRLLELAAHARSVTDTPRHNLPLELNSFIGRQREIAELTAMLAPQDVAPSAESGVSGQRHDAPVRLVTLTGVGGTGKTRLALRVAALLADAFRDGVRFIELAHLANPSLVPEAVAAAFGLKKQRGRDERGALQDFVRSKEIFIVLDNCEHLIQACAELADMLARAAPRLKILATSREALGIAGEHIYPVSSLALPEAQQSFVDLLKQSDAVHLFLDRALAVRPDFQITYENASTVIQICARLDGIPLAIELAAARVKDLSVEQIAARLDDRFRLLTAGSRAALPRQRTLQAAIDWSFELLSDRERVLLRRLAVFKGSWTLEAAEFVCADEAQPQQERAKTTKRHSAEPVAPLSVDRTVAPREILDLLARLVNKSLVVAHPELPTPRYHMLETIQQYAEEKLLEAGEAEMVRTRHLQFYVGLAHQAEPHLQGAQQAAWLERLDAEYDDIHAALTRALESRNTAPGLRLAADLRRFWIFRAHWHEPRVLIETLLEADTNADALTRAEAYHLAGLMEYFIGNLEQGNALGRRSESLSLEAGAGAKATAMLGYARNLITYTELHDAREEQKMLEENLELFRQAGDRWGEAHTLFNIGQALHAGGDFSAAEKFYRHSMAIFRACGDEFRTMQQIAALAYLAYARGKYERARKQLEQVYTWYRSKRLNIEIDSVLETLGAIAIRQQDFEGARSWYRECLLFSRQLGVLSQLAECCVGFAAIALSENKFERAAQLVGAAQIEAETRKFGLNNAERMECERLTGALEAVLGPDELEDALNSGRALTQEQAVELALKDDRT